MNIEGNDTPESGFTEGQRSNSRQSFKDMLKAESTMKYGGTGMSRKMAYHAFSGFFGQNAASKIFSGTFSNKDQMEEAYQFIMGNRGNGRGNGAGSTQISNNLSLIRIRLDNFSQQLSDIDKKIDDIGRRTGKASPTGTKARKMSHNAKVKLRGKSLVASSDSAEEEPTAEKITGKNKADMVDAVLSELQKIRQDMSARKPKTPKTYKEYLQVEKEKEKASIAMEQGGYGWKRKLMFNMNKVLMGERAATTIGHLTRNKKDMEKAYQILTSQKSGDTTDLQPDLPPREEEPPISPTVQNQDLDLDSQIDSPIDENIINDEIRVRSEENEKKLQEEIAKSALEEELSNLEYNNSMIEDVANTYRKSLTETQSQVKTNLEEFDQDQQKEQDEERLDEIEKNIKRIMEDVEQGRGGILDNVASLLSASALASAITSAAPILAPIIASAVVAYFAGKGLSDLAETTRKLKQEAKENLNAPLDDPNLTKIEQMPDIKTQVEDFADKSALDYQINQRLNNPDLLGTSDVSSAVDFIMGRFDAEKQAQSEMKAKIKSKFPDATEIQILAAMRRTFPDMEPSPEAIAEYEKITGKSMSGPMFGIFPATTGARKAFDAYVEESISNLKPNTPAEAPESNPTPITPPVQSMPINGTLSTETDLSSINDKLDSIRDEILDSVSRPNLNIIQPPPYESIAGGGVPPATSNPRTNVSVYTHNPESSISDYNNSIFDAMV